MPLVTSNNNQVKRSHNNVKVKVKKKRRRFPAEQIERIKSFLAVFWIHMFLGLPDPDPLVRGMDPKTTPAPDPDPSIIKQKMEKKTLIPTVL